jgi:hypothetical protein
LETQGSGGNRRTFLILGVGALAAMVAAAFILFSGGASRASAPATLDVLAPSVSTRADAVSSFQPARSGQPLHVGDSLRTDASGLAGISYFDGSLTRIGPGTTYTIEQLAHPKNGREIVGRLDVGQTFHRVTKVSGSGSRFEVRSSHAIAAVRGTDFFEECPAGSDKCRVGVTKGAVAVKSDTG